MLRALAGALALGLLLSGCAVRISWPPSPASPSSGPHPFDTGNPRHNLSSASFTAVCGRSGVQSQACHSAELVSLIDAHAGEGLAAPSWPQSFWTLPYDEQLFILADEERVDRDLAPVEGISAGADRAARPGALDDNDPTLSFSRHPQLLAWASNWASDYSAVSAEFDWMYNDGVSSVPGQGNLDCQRRGAKGCWGHRDNTLIEFPGSGQGTAMVFGGSCVADPEDPVNLSCAEVFELESQPPANWLFTWRQALRMGA